MLVLYIGDAGNPLILLTNQESTFCSATLFDCYNYIFVLLKVQMETK